MKKLKSFATVYANHYPFPDYLQRAVEQNISRSPVWNFPNIPPLESDQLTFVPLNFSNWHHVLEMFADDPDKWVEQKFKTAEKVYEYVAVTQIISFFSNQHGGNDWLVFRADECIGMLHAFDFNREKLAYQHRRCEIGYVCSSAVRATGRPLRIIQHFIQYLFEALDLLYVTANVRRGNGRSMRFLEKLGFAAEQHFDKEDWTTHRQGGTIGFERFRSAQAKECILKHRKEATKRAAEWQW